MGQAAPDGDPELAPAGRTIFEEGIPESNIVACGACHGPNAEGVGEIPRLGGLSYFYLKRRLKQWGEGYHAAARPPMPRIAGKLGPNEIEALASYLSFISYFQVSEIGRDGDRDARPSPQFNARSIRTSRASEAEPR